MQATNTQGFNYTPHPALFSNPDCISVGDEFSLDGSMYKAGSSLTLVNYDATSPYCMMTV
jgi:hypothetical protein